MDDSGETHTRNAAWPSFVQLWANVCNLIFRFNSCCPYQYCNTWIDKGTGCCFALRTWSRPFSTICSSFINASTKFFSYNQWNLYLYNWLNSFTVFSIICPGLGERYFLVSDIRNRRRWEWLDWFSLRKQSRKTGFMYSTQHLILKDRFLLGDSRQFLHF